jgi:hypothetical protein
LIRIAGTKVDGFWPVVVVFPERHFNSATIVKSEQDAIASVELSGHNYVPDAFAEPIPKLVVSVGSAPTLPANRYGRVDGQHSAIEAKLPIVHHERDRTQLFRHDAVQGRIEVRKLNRSPHYRVHDQVR